MLLFFQLAKIAQTAQTAQFRMKNLNQVGQQIIRMKRSFFVIGHFICIASVHRTFLECLETGITDIIGL